MSGKYALIIGNTEYIDPGLAQLTAPGRDAEDFSRVLLDKEICTFDDVKLILNQPEYVVRAAIDEFFDQKKTEDLLILYFSGHGVRDELGALYLAVKNTSRSRLRSTAIKSDYIRESMDQSRSKRQILILDCCNSGAFAQGTKAATGVSIGTATAFEGTGYGRVVLTASDSTQFAWEGDKIIGETDNSLFTHFLVKGLEGEADTDSDGRITIDELYDYAYEQIVSITPKQTPGKWSYKQQGEIVLRQNTRIEDIKPVALPEDLVNEIEDIRPYVREIAVQKLERLLKGKNIGLARSARDVLTKMSAEDDSRRVSQAATQALSATPTPEQISKQLEKSETKTEEKNNKATIGAAKKQKLEEKKRTAGKDGEMLPAANSEAEHGPTLQADAILSNFEVKKQEPTPKVQPQKQLITVTGQQPEPHSQPRPTRSVIPRWLLAGIIGSALLILVLCGFGTSRLYAATLGNSDALKTATSTWQAVSFTKIAFQPENSSPQPQPLTPTPKLTPTPTLTLEVVEKGIFATINVDRAFYYLGPGQGYPLTSPKRYQRGDIFEVLAIDRTGTWIFCNSSDDVKGWLSLEWVEVTVKPSVIPTASYIPPAPHVKPTRQPSSH
jgi:hypothetical protein